MSTAPFEQAIATARKVLTNVKADQLTASTPCSSWDVSALIDHVIGAQYFFLAGMTGQPPAGPENPSSGDYVAAFDEATAKSLEAFSAEGALAKSYDLPFGSMPGAAVLGLATTDTLQHSWDLAKATGQSTDLAPDLAEQVLAQSKMAIQEAFRGPEGAPFGAEQSAPAGSSKADELAAFLGRTV